ncbi:MAG: alanine--tRNA ligase [Clostridia bacterium]
MEKMGLNEIREKFLSYFESKGHKRLPSFSLVPNGDKSLLLINAGMAPLKKFFTGEVTPPSKRVTTCQKCIRTPDIERVGKTARHGTYFEMLGNFSFGDYFKKEAIAFAWEFSTEVMKLPTDKIYISIYEDDDEAFDIWTNDIGISPLHITRLGKADNFWEHGSGPCGPCSELYYDRGEKYGCGDPNCGVGCECDRFIEYWNIVFTQFDSDGKGKYTPLDHPNIDTGMGLERLACIMQSVDNLFEVDTIQNIMAKICQTLNVTYKQDEKTDVSLRVITDHIRSTCFMIGDGVLPSNEGRGYVLRRLLRRAARHGRLLGKTKPFLFEIVDTVIAENKHYSDLADNSEYIKKIIKLEEEKFLQTIVSGEAMLNNVIATIKQESKTYISGEDAFKLYDTYGFPIDLIREIAEEEGITVNEADFEKFMAEQKERARGARQKDTNAWSDTNLLSDFNTKTNFIGYEKTETTASILGIIAENELAVSISGSGAIILDTTPFYAESGGQVADIGKIYTDKGVFEVDNCQKTENGVYLHTGKMINGSLKLETTVTAAINTAHRDDIARNHSAVHLLQAALRIVLGDHIRQAGSYVDNEKLRFDFSHFTAVTKEELQKVEQIVNSKILAALPVKTDVMSIEKAKETGAMALFNEKYGDTVRVITMGDFSKELCGGTHINDTSFINLFKITSEGSAASGVRRIEAVTGNGVLNFINTQAKALEDTMNALKVQNITDLASHATELISNYKELEKKLDAAEEQLADTKLDGLFENVKEVNGVKVMFAVFSGTKVKALRILGDKVKAKAPKMVAVLVGISDMKATMLVVCGEKAVASGANAGKIIKKLAAICNGSGGGKPDSAMAGLGSIENMESMKKELLTIIEETM